MRMSRAVTSVEPLAGAWTLTRDEPFVRRWVRRTLTISSFAGIAVLLLTLMPLWFPVAVVIDVIRGSRFATSRALAFLLVLFWLETIGVAFAGLLFVPRALRLVDDERFIAQNYALQTAWVTTLHAAVVRFFSLRVVVEGAECVAGGPLYVFFRHVSVGDTLFPAIHITRATGMRLRYVLKDELLWDPCLDVVGQRIPNAFVRRDSEKSGEEVKKVRGLARALPDDEGVLLFPEGTRFTVEKRERALAKLRERDPGLVPLAERIVHALPPKLGGVLALLDENPRVDALFCAHTGLEGISTIGHLFNGSLVGRRVVLRFWRVPHAAIPHTRDERVRWLYTEWMKMDALVESERDSTQRVALTNASA
jgi:1-acyl-sn-glycerol-3-phosphate acyltransferase